LAVNQVVAQHGDRRCFSSILFKIFSSHPNLFGGKFAGNFFAVDTFQFNVDLLVIFYR
jgi:hypothetical protein